MLDYRIRTFLKVCQTMNYRKAADELNMSQPSITQHIQSLEEYYNCKLFIYDKRKLFKTEQAQILERFSLSMRANEKSLVESIKKQPSKEIRIGATKTIGNYVINKKIEELIDNKNYQLTFIIDNTKNLLELLEKNELDLLIIEGLFNKNNYDYQLYKKEKFVGICSMDSHLVNKKIEIKDILDQPLILREKGSGTRDILEQELHKNSFSIKQFKTIHYISSFEYIKEFVKKGKGISFTFKAVAESDNEISIFNLNENEIEREFNFVFLKNTNQQIIINYFKE